MSDQASQTPSGVINYFLHLGQAKRTFRTGWILRGVKNAESIADHMYRMSMMAFLAPSHLDRSKCIEMCLIHDAAECIVGDLTPEDNVDKKTKARLENESIKKLTDFIKSENESAGELVSNIYAEYSAHESAEAKFVKCLDLFDMYLQAYEYEQLDSSLDLSEFFSTATTFNFVEPVKHWVNELLSLRQSGSAQLPPDSNMNTVLRQYLNKM